VARSTGTNTSRTTVTNESGVFTLIGLTPGEYEISAEAPGFKKSVNGGITLAVAQAARLDIKLELGSVSETVNAVERIAVVETENASTGTVIDNRKVVELPLNGRQFYGLALLVPGANQSAENSTTGFRGGFNISGRAETNNNFSVNGFDNNDQSVNAPTVRPSVDDIQEFKLLTGIYSAEYGRSAGGQVVVVTKSGSNAFHGTVYEFLRNQKMDAANYFAAGQKLSFRRNNFGATVGGPIKKDKTFFHFAYEGLRLSQQVTAIGTVPTLAFRNGDFSSLLAGNRTIKDPLGTAVFPGNIVPPTRINAIGQAMLRQFPNPTATTALLGAPSNNFTLNGAQTEEQNQYATRIDHTFSEKDNMTVTYQYFKDPVNYLYNSLCGSSVMPNGGCFTGHTGQLFGISEYHTFSPTVVNEIRAGVNRMRQPRVQSDSNIDFWGPFGLIVGAKVPDNTGVPSVTITGFSRLGGPTNLPQNRWDTTYDYRDTLSWQKGAHAMKFGFQFRPFDSNFTFVSNGRGAFNFNASTAAPTSGYAPADVILGYPTTTNNNPLAPPIYGRTKAYFGFAQDDWKATSRLTFNFGLRWEFQGPYYDAQDRLSSFNQVTGKMDLQNQNGLGKLYKNDYTLWAPRFGFAYQPFGNAKTVIRGGAGAFYDNTITFNGLGAIVNSNIPFRQPQFFTSSVAQPITLSNPFPVGSTSGVPTAGGIDVDYTVPHVYQWSMAIQRELPANILLDVTYFGSRGTHLPLTTNVNQPLPGPGTAAQVQARRPYPAYGNITFYQSSNTSDYESLQMKLEKGFSHGIALLVSETFGKSIDYGAQAGSTSNSSKVGGQDQRNIQGGERGLSDYNVKNRLVISTIGELPFGTGKAMLNKGIVAKVVGGFQLSGIMTSQGGRPWTPYFTANISNTSQLSDRPNVVAGCDPYSGFKTPARWVNPACFTTPTAGTFGNLGRNTLIGPGMFNLDFAIDRNFKITEGIKLQFRAESFNVLNHPNFNLPNTTYDTPNFASLTSAADPRQIQFGLKLIY
jgi:outer membrane receptor protein involved in Fe transport